eukprot:11474689-Heterocapsa_arctica.AAC.1
MASRGAMSAGQPFVRLCLCLQISASAVPVPPSYCPRFLSIPLSNCSAACPRTVQLLRTRIALRQNI